MHQQPIPTTSPAEPDTTERTFRLTTALPGYRPLVLTCALADLPNRVREAFDPAGTGTEVEVSADGSTATVLNPDGSTGFVFAVTVEPAPAPVQPTTPHHTSPLTIAAALRRAAADLENLGDIPISSTQVSIDLRPWPTWAPSTSGGAPSTCWPAHSPATPGRPPRVATPTTPRSLSCRASA
ncbi:hypothetical protein [Micromonospora echinospora]|uniref:hypothetical protein n=1 Tax=Micromonospora echinospora TaxID=1877 RepID=UPI003A8523E7